MLTLISFLSFLLPTQLGLHFNNFQNTVYGFRIDYLIPTLYLTDIIALLIIVLGVKNVKFGYRYILFVIFVVINILISTYQIASIYKWVKVTEMLLLGVIIFNTKKFDIFKHFIKPLSYSVFVACILGIWQFLIKGSVGGIFYLLGERSFLFNDPNIAPYPYATFSHPNSFAGFLLVFGIFLLQHKNKFNNERRLRHKYFWTLTALVTINLILTNSLNIYITMILLLFFKFKNNISILMFVDFTQRTITYRIELMKVSWQMIKNHFWFGVGLNNFIPNLVKVSNTFVNAWELQPVHNIFLLMFSETGVIGLCALCFMFYVGLTAYNLPLIAILFTGLSDHYWITLQQNLLLFVYVVIISIKQKHDYIL
ncbi:MAG: hypothetical protein ACD_19C00014G0058 [uncultured bacterium]|nr:MAG: hypothetical protein ACD_19C00014G0058 [uncultured bacterium]